jgi:hypothetical protein
MATVICHGVCFLGRPRGSTHTSPNPRECSKILVLLQRGSCATVIWNGRPPSLFGLGLVEISRTIEPFFFFTSMILHRQADYPFLSVTFLQGFTVAAVDYSDVPKPEQIQECFKRLADTEPEEAL